MDISKLSEHDKENYPRLQKVLEENRSLFSRLGSHARAREVVVGAAVLHFSTIPPKEQFEVIADYLEKF